MQDYTLSFTLTYISSYVIYRQAGMRKSAKRRPSSDTLDSITIESEKLENARQYG